MSGWDEGSPSPEEVAALGADRLAEGGEARTGQLGCEPLVREQKRE